MKKRAYAFSHKFQGEKVLNRRIGNNQIRSEWTNKNFFFTTVKESGINLLGTLVGMGLGFTSWIILARYLSPTEFGLFYLALALTNFLVVISSFGLTQGAPRFIAFHLGNGDECEVENIISTLIIFSIISGILAGFFLFMVSDLISIRIFSMPVLSQILILFSVVVPFWVFQNINISIFRGFGRAGPKVIFQDFSRFLFFIIFLGIIVYFDLKFFATIFAFIASFSIVALVFAFYLIKNVSFNLTNTSKTMTTAKKLLFFSAPLTLIFMLNIIMLWTDTWMLAFFKGATEVGLYNGAANFSKIIPQIMGVVAFIYMPMAAVLYSQHSMDEINKIYKTTTKWVVFIIMPIFLLFIFFPKLILDIFLGIEYVYAYKVLMILSAAYFFQVFLGLQGETLIALGKVKLLLYSAVVGVIVNLVLNYSLIPTLGIIGAALATMVSWCIVQTLNLYFLFQTTGLRPFKFRIVLSIILTFSIVYLIVSFGPVIYNNTIWSLLFYFCLFIILHTFSFFITGNIDKKEKEFIITLLTDARKIL